MFNESIYWCIYVVYINWFRISSTCHVATPTTTCWRHVFLRLFFRHWSDLLNLPWSQFSQRFLLKVQKCEVRICLESPLGTYLCIYFLVDHESLKPSSWSLFSLVWCDFEDCNPWGKTTKHVRNTTWLTMKDMVCTSIDCIRFCMVWCTSLLWTESSTSW